MAQVSLLGGQVEVRVGSSTDLAAPKFDFRSSPESGLKSDIRPCPFRARSSHWSRLHCWHLPCALRKQGAPNLEGKSRLHATLRARRGDGLSHSASVRS